VWSVRKKKAVKKVKGKVLVKGLPASPGIGIGRVKIVLSLDHIAKVRRGDVLVTPMTTPDMVPAMKKAAAIVTDEGGITSHAAIVSRELGIPCVVGTGNATRVLKEEEIVSVDGFSGIVYEGFVKVKRKKKVRKAYKTRTKILVNLGVPEIADVVAKKPVDGVGLMRQEFIVATYVKAHPLYLKEIGEEKKFIDTLAQGIERVARAFHPRPIILRFSDFKTNEYRELEGGEKYEPVENNPMLGWRGCSRYISPQFRPAFEMEIKAVKKVRKKWDNVWVMLPFVRTIDELKQVIKILEKKGLRRGKKMKLYLMAEVPSVVFLVDKFAKYCDGFSIGSNDLTQLVLGVDRDSEILAKMGLFDERNEAVKRAIEMLIEGAHEKGKTVSICGQAPSQYPEFARFLVKCGIDSISVNPDVVEEVRRIVWEAEKRYGVRK